MQNAMEFDCGIFLADKKESQNVLEEYDAKRRRHEIFNVSFSTVDVNNNMIYSFRENGQDYKITMKPEELTKEKGMKLTRAISLNSNYPVMVHSIDRNTNTVYVYHLMAKDIKQKQLVSAIHSGLKAENPIRVKARISYLRGNTQGHDYAVLDIGGLGLTGYLFRDDWSVCYTSNIRQCAHVGDIITVEVSSVLTPKSYKQGDPINIDEHKFIFRCSRKNAMDTDPWKGIEDRYPVGSQVQVTCTEKRPDKFFGKIEGLDEINVLCH